MLYSAQMKGLDSMQSRQTAPNAHSLAFVYPTQHIPHIVLIILAMMLYGSASQAAVEHFVAVVTEASFVGRSVLVRYVVGCWVVGTLQHPPSYLGMCCEISYPG